MSVSIHVDKLYELALQYLRSEDYDYAIKYIDLCLNYDSKNSEFIRIKGIAFFMTGEIQKARTAFCKSIKINKQNFLAHSNLGNVFFAEKKYQEAIKSYQTSLLINPNYFEAISNLGNLYQEVFEFNRAIELYTNAININNLHFESFNNRGNAYQKIKKFDDAIQDYLYAIKINANYYQAYLNLSYALVNKNIYNDAIIACNKSIEIKPDYLDAYLHKASIYKILNQPTEALELYNRALTIEPGFSEAINNRGHLFLSQMNFLQGWPDYEARFHTKAYDSKPIESKKPIWNGDFSLQGPLFIWGEQGVGDQILHSSMLTNLMTLPQKKIVGIQDKLIPLFKRSFPDFEFIDLSQETVPEERYEAHIPIGSLGQFFKRTTADFSEQKPYLVDDSLLTAQFRKQLKHSGKILCGLSWKSVNQRVGDDKSIPLTALLPILNNPKLEFINLQYGDVTTEMEAFQKEHQIHIQSLANLDIYNDLDGLASLIQACDLVITGSNSTAHLAGAMGKETFLLLPKHAGKFWYWHTLDKKSLWYPSINIYQQKEQGEWSDPVLEIKKELESRSE